MTCTIEYENDAQLVRKLTAILTTLGYCVKKESPDMVTVSEVAKRVGRAMSTVSRSLQRPSCPPFAAVRSNTGRILRLEPTPELLSYLTDRPTRPTPASAGTDL